MRRALVIVVVALAAGLALAGCARKAEQASTSSADSLLATNPVEQPQGSITPQTEYQQQEQQPEAPAPKPKTKTTKPPAPAPRAEAPENPGVTVPTGTGIKIAVDVQISSETAHEGDAWTGVVKEPVVIGTAAPIPAGSTVSGIIAGVRPAEKGSRALLLLAVRSVEVGGKSHAIDAVADSIIAGSTRTRNVGAIAGSAAAGALIGKAVGGSGKGALIGGILGGAAATGAVAGTKGYQVVVKEGSELTFTVRHPVTMR